MITVSLVEDERPTRAALERILRDASGFVCLGAHPNAETAFKHISQERPDVALVELGLSGPSGVECIRRLRSLVPGTKIVVLAQNENAAHVLEAFQAGANGHVLKTIPPAGLLAALVDVCRDGAPMSSKVAAHLVAQLHELSKSADELQRLTPRETEVLDYLARGYLYKQIAARLGITYQTVNDHLKRIYEKLDVHSRSQAVAKYLRR